ncbi:MAG TPA: hypothetical protein VFG53_11295 [Anaeromyxobacter sp.]|nr:hypothetical protein [Anaeromyxobacter sp.]
MIIPGQIEPELYGQCISGIAYTPSFHLQSIIYMPPGAQSSVLYSSGSSEGNSVTIQTQSGTQTTISMSVFGIGASTQYSEGVINGNTFSMTKMDSYGRGESVGTGFDHPDRGNDVFDVWANVQQTHYLSTSNGWERIDWSTVGGAAPNVYSYTAYELQGLRSPNCNIPGSCQYFGTLAASDKAGILSMDAPLNTTSLDPRRYQRVAMQEPTQTMTGPDYQGAPINSYVYTETYNTSYDAFNGSYVNSSYTILANVSVGETKSGFGTNVTWVNNYSETRHNVTGSQKVATLTLRTPTVGCYMEVAIYIDAVFGTYLVVPANSVGCT